MNVVLGRYVTVQQNVSVHPYMHSTQVGRLNSFVETGERWQTETC